MRAKHFCVLTTTEPRGKDLAPLKYISVPVGLGCRPFLGGGSVVVVDLLFYAPLIICRGYVLDFVLVFIIFVLSSVEIILTRKRELVALLLLSFRCLDTVNVLLLTFLYCYAILNYCCFKDA